MADGRTIVFFPEGAYGPTNNCVGIGQVLRERGHRVVFIVEESFAGNLEAQGFEERLMRLGPAPEEPEIPGQFWIDFIRDTAPVFRKPTIEQLGEFIAPTFQALIDGATYVQPRLEAIVDELGPDTIVEDNVVSFPAIMSTAAPWVRLLSCNPAEIKDPRVAPFSSGYRGRRPVRVAGVPRRGRPDAPRAVDRVRHVLPRARPARPAVDEHRPGLHAREPVPQHLLLPGRGRLRALGARWARPGTSSTRRSARPTRRGSCPTSSRAATARSSTSAWAASGRRTWG